MRPPSQSRSRFPYHTIPPAAAAVTFHHPFRHVCGDVSGGGGLGGSEEEALRVSVCTGFEIAVHGAMM